MDHFGENIFVNTQTKVEKNIIPIPNHGKKVMSNIPLKFEAFLPKLCQWNRGHYMTPTQTMHKNMFGKSLKIVPIGFCCLEMIPQKKLVPFRWPWKDATINHHPPAWCYEPGLDLASGFVIQQGCSPWWFRWFHKPCNRRERHVIPHKSTDNTCGDIVDIRFDIYNL